jgi:hypothetical protein
MSVWHTVTDSHAFRWFVKRSPGRHLFRSRLYQRLDLLRNDRLSSSAVRRDAERFRHVQAFCFFVGHNKSGTSMLGGLLDAHPDAIVADEADVLRYVDAGFAREQIFHLLEKASRAEARKGRVTARRLEPYSYWVPGQWQGRSDRPLVVGDSTSGSSTRRLGTDPHLLAEADRVMAGVDVKLIQVIRNPFDPISVMMVRGRRSFQCAIDHYFSACETLVALRHQLDETTLLPVRHETFVADPETGLRTACRFLGLEAEPDYLQACARIIRGTPDRSRAMVDWSRAWIEQVEGRIRAFDFLEGYTYDT